MHYQPLDRSEDEIRLLTLSPSGGDCSSPISVELAHYSLKGVSASRSIAVANDNAREPRFPWGDYVALSYVWGSADSSLGIIVNGHTTQVTRNLEAALRQLRDSPEAAAGLKFWIDALCIDQRSIQERNVEVKRMKDIYKTARSIITWLGPEFDGLDAAVRLVNELDHQSRVLQHPTVFLSPWSRGSRDVFAGAVRPLHNLFGSMYWQRLWIIQELAFGGDDVWIVCGSRRLKFEGVGRTAKFISDAFVSMEKELAKELNNNEILELSALAWRISQLYSIGHSAINLDVGTSMQHVDHVVRLGQHAAATDPKDKVYGLLGLLGDSLAAKIVPNYSLSLQQVYADFVRGFVTAFGSLNVILLRSSGDRAPGWPSWIPRLDRAPEDDGAVLDTHYRTGGENVLDVSFSSDGRHLECYGVRIEIGARPVGGSTQVTPKPPPSDRRRRTGHRADNEDAWVSRLWSSMGRSRPQTDGASSTRPYDQDPIHALVNLPLPSTVQDIGAPGSLEWIHSGGARQLANMDPSGPQAAEAITRSMQALEQADLALRSLEQRTPSAFTMSGYFVWAYEPLGEADIVCVLLGCSYPVILRPCGEHFEVVSECYIYEIMAGEALDLLGSDEVALETFSIC